MRLLDLAITLGMLLSSGFQVGSPWPKLQGNALNNGNGSGGGSNGSLRWSVPLAVNSGSSPAVAADRTIYVALSGNLTAVNPIDGSQEWSYPTGCLPGTQSSPSVGSDGTIYATGNGAPLLLAIDPAGKEKWQFSGLADGGVYLPTGAPTIGTDGTIYLAAEEFVSANQAGVNQNYLFALNPNGSVKWEFSAGQLNVIASMPAIGSDGTLYFGSSTQSSQSVTGAVYAVDPTTGLLKWSFSTTGQIVSSPAIGPDGTIYVGEQGGTKNLYQVTPDGIAKILFTANGSIVSSPAVASDSSLYFPESDGSYYALNSDGTIRWSLPQGTCTAEATVIGSDGTIYFGARDGRLTSAFQQGTTIWSYAGGNPVSSSLAIGEDGTLYYSDSSGAFNSLGTEIDTIPVVDISLSPTTVVGGAFSTATVTIQSQAPMGGALVHLESSDPTVSVPPFTEVAAGSTQSTFLVGTIPATNGTTSDITATSGNAGATATLTVRGATLARISISPSSVVAPTGATGSLVLSAPAPTGGISIQISSNSRAIGFPPVVTVPAGSLSASFPVTTTPVVSTTVCTITASQGGVTAASSLTIDPPTPTALTVSPTTVLGGASATGTVTLSGQAGPTGQPVSLISSSPSAAVPSMVTVLAGTTKAGFTISTLTVSSSTTVTIIAAVGSTQISAGLTLNATGVSSLTLSPASLVGGGKVTGTVTLSAPAGATGFIVSLQSSQPAAAKILETAIVLRGKSTGQFSIETAKVSSQTMVTISASLNGSSQSATLVVDPPAIVQLTVSPTSVLGGKTATGTVSLQTTAPSGGIVVRLSSGSASATVPASVTIGSGRKSATFKVATSAVASKTTATITGSLIPTSRTANLTITPATLLSLSVNPNRLKAGVSGTGTVTINGPAPTSGAVVRLSASKSAATVPSSVTIPAGQTKAIFTFATAKVSVQTGVTISATLGSVTKSAGLTVTK